MLAKHFGCTRFDYNHMLARRQARFNVGLRSSYVNDSAELTRLKCTTDWLNEVSSLALQEALRHLDHAYRNFFARRAGFPRFKRKRAA
ncbi:transposase [Paraburkholderia sp. UYCP14C]|nr:transposase [Paraburkholderia sp. UYCP14C]